MLGFVVGLFCLFVCLGGGGSTHKIEKVKYVRT